MASATYSFIDIAVLDAIRTRFAAGEGLVVLTPALDEIVWANGPGARFAGHADIEAAVGAAARFDPSLRRRILALAGFPAIGAERQVVSRMGGFRNALVQIGVVAIALPDGAPAILLSVPAGDDRAAIDGFSGAGHFAAIVDGDGTVAQASSGFAGLAIGAQALHDMVAAVAGDRERLAKRRIAGRRLYPAGIARLTDEPPLHLLVVVDEAETDLAADAAEPAAPRPPQADGASARAPATGHENWYFGREERHETPRRTDDRARQDAAPVAEAARAEPSGAERPPARFAWRIDEETRFVSLSPSFAEALGAPAADIVGRRFREVANAFGLDENGEIAALLERRDTWSGRTVLWPLTGTRLKVPVDLAALPVYARGRIFEGFRGFGIVRTGEAVDDPEGIGMALVRGEPKQGANEEPVAVVAEPPAPSDAPEPPPAGRKVIRLAERRPPKGPVEVVPEEGDGRLSATERSAFREIADRLRAYTVEEEDRLLDAVARQEDAGQAEDPQASTGDGGAAPAAAEATEATASAAPEGSAEAASPEPAAAPAEGNADGEAPADEPRDEPPHGEAAPPRPNVDFLPSAFSRGAETAAGFGIDPAVLSHLPVPVLVHAGDVLHYANPEFLTLTGYADIAALAAEGGLGALFADPYEDGGRPPAERPLVLRTAGGAEMPVRAHLQSVPWKGGKALLLALRTLETARPAAEAPAPAPSGSSPQEMQMRVDEMRTIIDTATDGVVIVDNDGMIRSISRPAEALFGLEDADVAGRPFVELFAIESQRAAADYLNSLTDNGVASVLNDGREVIGREGRGRFIPLFMTMGRLPGDSGFCAVVRDITQWKRAEEELTQARSRAEHTSSQKSEFLARVSHEIRTPLNAIIGFSELMIDEKFGPVGSDRYRDYLRDINRSGNHVLDLVNDLLDISKIEAGEQEMHYEAVSLNDTLGETVAIMQPQANRERVIIRSSFASNLPEVVADLRSVRQIALNLLSNAVRYTPAGGQVIISTAYEKDGSIAMRVRDTGLGMSSAELEQALKPFKQLNTLKRRRGDGTGLGLPLTRAMVEANRARFSIESTPGSGTLVEITFPPTRVLAD